MGEHNDQPQDNPIAAIMVPFPMQGHVNEILHLANLIASYGVAVYFAGSMIHNQQARLRLHGWDPENLNKITFHDFQLPHVTSIPSDLNANTNFPGHLQSLFDALEHLREPVFQLLQELSTKFRRIIIIHDTLMASIVQDVKSLPNAETYALHSVCAFTVFLFIWESIAEKPFQLDFDDIPISIPSKEECFTPEFMEFMAKQYRVLNFESGRLYNTTRLVEGKYIDLLEKLPANSNIKLFAIGPLNPVKTVNRSSENRHECLKWLDKQGKGSVMYISFGSSTSMTDKQINELAIGLQRSGQKFLWVLRNADGVNHTTEDNSKSPRLPQGFEKTVEDRGMVVKDWAPQLEVLGHPSTGGFMSHCGWNSCIESISFGVPIAAWPMHSDQPRNSILITQVLRIGLLVRDWEHRADLVRSETVEDIVRRLMTSNEGEGMRKRACELATAVQVSVTEGGSSRLEMDSFIAHIIR